jgi:thioredoxin 2
MGIYRCAACGAVNRSGGGAGARCERCRAVLDTSGAPQRIDAAALVTLIASSPAPVLVEFAAPGTRGRVGEVATVRAGELLCLQVDSAGEPAAMAAYGVGDAPTLVLFFRGEELARLAPAAPGSATVELSSWLGRTGLASCSDRRGPTERGRRRAEGCATSAARAAAEHLC